MSRVFLLGPDFASIHLIFHQFARGASYVVLRTRKTRFLQR